MDPRRKQMLSIGRRMPGMADWGQNSSSGISLSAGLKDLIKEHAEARGSAIRVVIKNGKLDHAPLSLGVEGWEEELNALAKKLPPSQPCYVLVFREADTLLVTFVPELVKPRDKMLYASSKHSLKICVTEQVEEINASTLSEISHDEYVRRQEVEAPLSAQEKLEAEYATMETGGSYSLLARMLGGKGDGAVGLPGLAKGAVPSFLTKHAEGEGEEGDDEDAEEGEGEGVSEEEDEEATAARLEKEAEAAKEKAAKEAAAAEMFREAEEIRERMKQRKSKRVSKRVSLSKKDKENISTMGSALSSATSSRRDSTASKKSSKSKSKTEKLPKAEKEDKPAKEEKSTKSRKSSKTSSLRSSKRYSLSKLIKLREEDSKSLDLAHLERSLTSKSFEAHFKMSREEFDKLPTWKQIRLKQSVGLF